MVLLCQVVSFIVVDSCMSCLRPLRPLSRDPHQDDDQARRRHQCTPLTTLLHNESVNVSKFPPLLTYGLLTSSFFKEATVIKRFKTTTNVLIQLVWVLCSAIYSTHFHVDISQQRQRTRRTVSERG